jgi:GTP cyclohydrolase IA
MREAVKMMLEAMGEDPGRKGLVDTPKRVASMYEYFLSGMEADAGEVLKTVVGEKHQEMVILKDIAVFSLCEHHLLPFSGKAHIAYIPSGMNVTGISKLARVVDIYSRRLQIQERLTTQIADTIEKSLKPKGVLVIIEAEHMCITLRGVKKQGAVTVTSAVRGIFETNSATRAEATSLIKS